MLISINIFLQNLFEYNDLLPFIKISKFLTRKTFYFIYLLIIVYCNPSKILSIIFSFYISRLLNTILKNLLKQERPYNKYPYKIKYYKKKKIAIHFHHRVFKQCI